MFEKSVEKSISEIKIRSYIKCINLYHFGVFVITKSIMHVFIIQFFNLMKTHDIYCHIG